MSGSPVGRLTISLDTEIAWGRVSTPDLTEFLPQFERTREVIDRLLDAFARHEVRATWALVGRLIESSSPGGPKEGDSLGPYFDGRVDERCYEDPALNPPGNSYLRYPELIDRIRACATTQELASHTYNHCFFHDVADRVLIERDFDAMRRTAQAHGFTPCSLVFPKNQVGHLDAVARAGIRVYRSPDEHWFSPLPARLRRVLRQLDYALPIPASPVHAARDAHGMVALPGSIVFRREHKSWRRRLPMRLLGAKTIAGLERAARGGGTIHLWFHPFNFGHRTEAHFHELERVLLVADRLRGEGRLEILPMSAYAGTDPT